MIHTELSKAFIGLAIAQVALCTCPPALAQDAADLKRPEPEPMVIQKDTRGKERLLFPAQIRDGLIFSVDSVVSTISVPLQPNATRGERSIKLLWSVRPEYNDIMFLRPALPVIEVMTDDEGRDLRPFLTLSAADRTASERRTLTPGFWGKARRSPDDVFNGTITVSPDISLPRRFGRIAGHVDVMRATEIARIDVPLSSQPQAIKILDRITFVLSPMSDKGELQHTTTIAAGDGNDSGPYLLDVRLLTDEKIDVELSRDRSTSLWDRAQMTEEGLRISDKFTLRGDTLKRAKFVRVEAVPGVRPVRFDFDIKDLPLME